MTTKLALLHPVPSVYNTLLYHFVRYIGWGSDRVLAEACINAGWAKAGDGELRGP